MQTVAALLQQGASRLQGTENPLLAAQLLLAFVLQCDRIKLITWPEQTVNDAQATQYEALLVRRSRHEPLAYLLQHQEFWSLSFHINEQVLVPRADTEILVEAVLQQLPNSELAIIELGTGSGAIACALAHERPLWQLLATDVSPSALAIAKQNAKQLQLTNIIFKQADWFTGIPVQSFAAIISNPPYLAHDDPHLQAELLYEPHNALVSGSSGLEAYIAILSKAANYLIPGGLIAFEHGFTQAQAVQNLLADAGYSQVQTLPDLAGLPRVTLARR